MGEDFQARRKHLRLKSYDYSTNGAYFVTMCTEKSRPLIGPTEKEIIQQELSGLLQRFDGILIESLAILKNHVHVIFFLEESQDSLPRIVQAFKSLTTRRMKSIGYSSKRFWQRNYYEHVIRNEHALEKIREYIQNNPLAEQLDYDAIYDTFPDNM